MIELKARLRKWGNSFGIVVPQRIIQEENVREGEEVTVLMKKTKGNVLRETFGTHKFKKSVKELMKETDEELDFG